MLDYIDFLNVPVKAALALAGIFFIIQVIGELLEFKGVVVPEFAKLRKYFARKKEERDILHQVPAALKEVQKSIDEFKSHYSKDNIRMRDDWIKSVNESLKENDKWIKELDKKLDKNNADTLSLLIDSKRNTIINFASYVSSGNNSVTREQFNRIFKLHKEYEDIIAENSFKNGEIDIAFRIITEAYENHFRNHTFLEDVRGYDV